MPKIIMKLNLMREKEDTGIWAESVHTDVQRSLLQELNLVMRHYFHQSIDDIMDELRCQLHCIQSSSQPDVILKTIYQSGVLYQRSDKIVSQMRNAVARFVRGTYGLCSHCGGDIPVLQLMNTPTTDLCIACIEDRYFTMFYAPIDEENGAKLYIAP